MGVGVVVSLRLESFKRRGVESRKGVPKVAFGSVLDSS